MVGLSAHIPLVFSFKSIPFMHSGFQNGIVYGLTNTLSLCGLAVNINFVTSAALAVITVVPMMPKVSFTMFVLGRALRTIPVIAFVTLVSIAFPFFDNQPFGRGSLYLEIHKNITANCVVNGWRDIAFVTTSGPISSMCNIVSWFIAVDFRLYVLSFFVFVFLAKNPKLGMLMLVAQAVIGSVIHYWTLEANNIFPPIAVAFESSDILPQTFEKAYLDVRGYISSYTVGMTLGLVLLNVPKRVKVSITQVVLSLAALVSCMYSFISIYDPKTQESHLSRQQQVLFASTIRFFFLSSFAWLFYSFFLTSDFMISLSKHKIFTIGSRFSFSAFMIHPLFISYFQSTLTQTEDFSFLSVFTRSLFVMSAALPSGYLIMILVEYPFANLLKMSHKNDRKIQ